MIDVCEFINSKDVAAHLHAVGYEFSMPEAAFIVHWSRDSTLDSRVAAWQEIADTMPDCSMEGRMNMDPKPSFRRFLLDCIASETRNLACFFDSQGCVYEFRYTENGSDWHSVGNVFSTAEACLSFSKEYWEDDIPAECHLEKRYIDRSELCRGDCLCLNRNFQVIGIDSPCMREDEALREPALQFGGMWLALPVPFKRGDIVRDARHPERGLFVVDWMPTWGMAEFVENGFREDEKVAQGADRALARWLRDGDITDMGCGGFGMGENGDIFQEYMPSLYFDLEYAPSNLSDEDRWAEVVSAHLKHEIDFEEAQGLLRFLQLDNESRQLQVHYDGFYDKRHYPDGVWQRIRASGLNGRI